MSATDFLPEVWTAPEWPAMLVCGRRWTHSDPITGAPVATTFERLSHPVAIQLEPATVCFNFYGADGVTWTRCTPEEHGISKRCGGLALAEGWRCVDVKIDPFNFSAKGTIHTEKLTGFRGAATILRNIGIFLAWDRWNREKKSVADRCQYMRDCGFPLTEKALSRIVEKAGLSAKT